MTDSLPQDNPSAPSPTTRDKNPKDYSRVRRRNRRITSCLPCRRAKISCDKQQPCTACTRLPYGSCVYIVPSLDPEAQARLAEVKEKIGMLEKTLEDDVARKTHKQPFHAPRLPGQNPGLGDDEDEEDMRDLEFTDIATEHASYYEDEGNDEVVDLGIAIGRLRITERVGGLVRPRLSEELNEALKLVPHVDQSLNPFAGQSPSSWMSPSDDFMAPSSSFYFAPGIEKTTMLNHLPNRILVNKLIAHYWEAVHPIVRTLHRPSFEPKYHAFWSSFASGVEPPRSFQAILFAVLLQSVISMPADKSLTELGVEKQGLVDNFRFGTESALARANFLRTTKLETLQATVIYLLSLCRAEVSRAHSALMGAVIRLAECMGLHRDPSSYSSNPVEIHIRRLIWYQICFLDVRTCEATGPRPQIRRDEYDTRLPLNIEDDELELAAQRGENITQDSKSFTSMTITRMRVECFELFRMIWTERSKLQRRAEPNEKKTTLTSLLGRIHSFRAAVEKAYLPMMDRENPLHAVAMEMYGIMSSRLYLATLHPFASSDKRKMPERLRQIMISSCIMVVEHSMNIDQHPKLSQWSWYVGALHQYHSAMLLLSEMHVTQVDPALSARIWRCLDYTFELPSGLGENEKIRFLFSELIERTGSYASLRRVRAPSEMPHAGPRSNDDPSPWPASTRQAYLPEVFQSNPLEDHDSQHELGHVSSVGDGSSSGYAPPDHNRPYSQHANLHDPTPHQYNPGSLQTKGPIGAVPQVDWGTIDMSAQLLNEWDQIFDSAQLGPGNMGIPPFTFPTFGPHEFQWSGAYDESGSGMH